MQWLELDEGAQGLRPEGRFEGPRAWRARDVTAAQWTVEVPAGALAEIDAVVESLRRQQLPVCMLSAQMFELGACRAVMAAVRERLEAGIGVALVDRLPVERWSTDEARAVYWLLGQLLSRPVAQEWNGRIFRDILDEGGGQEYGNERAVTNRVLTFHTDNSGNRTRPDYVSLMALSSPSRAVRASTARSTASTTRWPVSTRRCWSGCSNRCCTIVRASSRRARPRSCARRC